MAPRTVLRPRAGLPPELAPRRRVPAAHASQSRQPELREPGSEALVRSALRFPDLRGRWLALRSGSVRSQAVDNAGGCRVPQPVDDGRQVPAPGRRRRPAVAPGEQLERGRVGTRGHPVRERPGAGAEPAAPLRVLQRELAGWAVLHETRGVSRARRALPLLILPFFLGAGGGSGHFWWGGGGVGAQEGGGGAGFVVGVVKAGGDGGAEEGEAAAGAETGALPDAARHHHLGTLARGEVGHDKHDAVLG